MRTRVLIPILLLFVVLALVPCPSPAMPGAIPGVYFEGDPDDLGHKTTTSQPAWVIWLASFTATWLSPGATP